MRTFTITADEGTLILEGTPTAASGPYEAWDYVARLEARSVSARVEVSDHLPDRFAQFFASLAQEWKGWAGERAYESLEPLLGISAKHDGKGLVQFTVLLRAGARERFGWSVSQRLSVELGQLESIAVAARSVVAVDVPVVV